jgi:hypothetical protein
MAFDNQLASQVALAHTVEVEAAVISLFSTHPDPRKLLQVYERLVADLESNDLYSALPDEALDFARAMRERLLKTLRDTLGG